LVTAESDLRAVPPPLSVTALAERWRCSEGTIRNMIRKGQLGCFRVGMLVRIPVVEVRRLESELSPPLP
jgi:excisionase family DNA binding protein